MKKHTYKSFQFLLVPLIVIFLSTTAFSPAPVAMDAVQADPSEAITAGITYLGTQLNEDGGVRWFDESSSAAATVRVVQALAAAGLEQDYLQSDAGNSPIDYLGKHRD